MWPREVRSALQLPQCVGVVCGEWSEGRGWWSGHAGSGLRGAQWFLCGWRRGRRLWGGLLSQKPASANGAATHTKQRFFPPDTCDPAVLQTGTYALWRLAQHVKQPERSRCVSELRNILTFRNCTTPNRTNSSPSHTSATTPFPSRYNTGYVSTSLPTKTSRYPSTWPLTAPANKPTLPSTASCTISSQSGTTLNPLPNRHADALNSYLKILRPQTTQATLPPHSAPFHCPQPSTLYNITNTPTASAQHTQHGTATAIKSEPHFTDGSNTMACPHKTQPTSLPKSKHFSASKGSNTNNTSLPTPNFRSQKSFNSSASSPPTLSSSTPTMKPVAHASFALQHTALGPIPLSSHNSMIPQKTSTPITQLIQSFPLGSTRNTLAISTSAPHSPRASFFSQGQETMAERSHQHQLPQQYTCKTRQWQLHSIQLPTFSLSNQKIRLFRCAGFSCVLKPACCWPITLPLPHMTDIFLQTTTWMLASARQVCVCVCVCVKLCSKERPTLTYSRGPGTYDCLSWPTKTRQHRGENVPAHFELLPKLSNLPCLVPSCSCG